MGADPLLPFTVTITLLLLQCKGKERTEMEWRAVGAGSIFILPHPHEPFARNAHVQRIPRSIERAGGNGLLNQSSSRRKVSSAHWEGFMTLSHYLATRFLCHHKKKKTKHTHTAATTQMTVISSCSLRSVFMSFGRVVKYNTLSQGGGLRSFGGGCTGPGGCRRYGSAKHS